MNFQDWFKLFQEQILNTSLIEWLAVGFGVTEVLLAKKNSIWLYPTGIISILLVMTLLYSANLYAEIVLNIYYLVMSVYGWLIWKNQENHHHKEVRWSTRKEIVIAVSISVIGFGIFYTALINLPEHFVVAKIDIFFTKSDVPIADAFVSAFAWAGMWLLAKRKVENWIFLNISNIVAIPLLFHKKLPLMACLTTFLFIVAVFGFFEWKKIINENKLKLA
ncbi:nicotinamide mononucleotide transporter [Pedobacter terrae]|uniref:Nicotinamide riboside transporter PnuC n=1 Tax=Pedobacter terrae TaxID=405671 RepID=A0A1G7TG08_9SPHI|nr:nicotinamide riboside transporter PnuC [Pedobacter terrae]SDG33490.1 nicotinamide mononucleotide transporter [Pedobacter terrae]